MEKTKNELQDQQGKEVCKGQKKLSDEELQAVVAGMKRLNPRKFILAETDKEGND